MNAVARPDDRSLDLVRSFLNTVDVEEGTDALVTPTQLTGWLQERGLAGDSDRGDADDLALARRLREALRAEVATHHGGPPDEGARRTLDALAGELPLRVAFGGEAGPDLAAAGDGVRAGLATLLAAVASLARTGAWRRLKICPSDTCRWAFYDESRNRSRRWCSMESCGNLHKMRAYRARQGAEAGGARGES